MAAQPCQRCGGEEYIPTHQFVKFEDSIHFLCQACWELFKGWYYHGARGKEAAAEQKN
jgi:hypothetical protein